MHQYGEAGGEVLTGFARQLEVQRAFGLDGAAAGGPKRFLEKSMEVRPQLLAQRMRTQTVQIPGKQDCSCQRTAYTTALYAPPEQPGCREQLVGNRYAQRICHNLYNSLSAIVIFLHQLTGMGLNIHD